MWFDFYVQLVLAGLLTLCFLALSVLIAGMGLLTWDLYRDGLSRTKRPVPPPPFKPPHIR